jgi:hypothetical protein
MRDMQARDLPSGAGLPDLSALFAIIPAAIAALPKTFFTAPFAMLNLAAGAVAPGDFRADPSHHFVAFLLNAAIRRAADNTPVDAAVLLRITDQNGKQYSPLQNGQVDVLAVAGNGRQPAVLPVPIIVAPGTTLTIEVQNVDAFAVNVRLALIGFVAGSKA